jgi:hypothetical protein
MPKQMPFQLLTQRRQLILLSLLGLMMVTGIVACQQVPAWFSSTSGVAPTPSSTPYSRPRPTDNGTHYGFIDKTGKFVIPPKFLGALSFSNGYAAVNTLKGKTYIDKAGKVIFPPGQYETGDAGCSANGLCLVERYQEELGGDSIYIAGKTYQAGYVNASGKLVIPLRHYEPRAGGFHDGLALISQNVRSLERQGEPILKYGYIDEKGEYAVPLQFDAATDFKDGIARVGIKKVEPDPKQPGKTREVTYYGFIDKTGRYIAQPIWRDDQEKLEIAKQFHEGVAWINDAEGRRTYIDTTGKVVISGLDNNGGLDSGGDFQEGLAIATRGKQKGFINHNGKFVILLPDEEYYDFRPFLDGLAAVAQKGKGWGFMNQQGEWVIKPQFESVTNFRGGIAVTNKTLQEYPKQTGSSVINYQGKTILPLVPDIGRNDHELKIEGECETSEGLICVANGAHGFGFMNNQGQIVIRPQFDSADNFSEGLAAVGVRTGLSKEKQARLRNQIELEGENQMGDRQLIPPAVFLNGSGNNLQKKQQVRERIVSLVRDNKVRELYIPIVTSDGRSGIDTNTGRDSKFPTETRNRSLPLLGELWGVLGKETVNRDLIAEIRAAVESTGQRVGKGKDDVKITAW